MNPQDKALNGRQEELIDSILRLLGVDAITVQQRCELSTEIARHAIGVMSVCRATSLSLSRALVLGDSRIRHIFVEIANGRGSHGGFLCSFAEAVERADPENLSILRATALEVIDKYGLEKYLDNFNIGEHQPGVS